VARQQPPESVEECHVLVGLEVFDADDVQRHTVDHDAFAAAPAGLELQAVDPRQEVDAVRGDDELHHGAGFCGSGRIQKSMSPV
jgi:hypothetical protein